MRSNLIRISGQLERKYDIPAAVAAAIREIGADYRVASFRIYRKPSVYRTSVGEGESLTVVWGDRSKTVEVQAECNVGAAGLFQGIGQTLELPEGAWLIRVAYYSGYIMSVVAVTAPALSGPC